MPAHQTMFDGPEMDVLVAWCRQHGLDWAQLLPALKAQARYRVETY